MKKYINPILSLGTAAALLGAIYFQNQNLEKLKVEKSILENQVDSLRDEVFMEQVESGRHEITREEILKKYPKVEKEYEQFYSHQTE